MTVPQHEAALMQALGFTPDDLAANRAGEMSEMQLYTLRLRLRRSVLIGGLLVFAGVFIASLMLFMGRHSEGGAIILSLIGIGLTLCNAALLGIFVRYWLRLAADIREGRVSVTYGTLKRVIKPVSRRVLNYAIRVGEAEVFVSQALFEVLAHNRSYTLYRAPNTGSLLAIEQDGEGA